VGTVDLEALNIAHASGAAERLLADAINMAP